MEISDNDVIACLRRFNAKQVELAAQRYTPGIDPSAPNIRIETLVTAIGSVGCGSGAQRRFTRFMDELGKAWDDAKGYCEAREDIGAQIDTLRAIVASLVPLLRARDASAFEGWNKRLETLADALEHEVTRWRSEEERLSSEEKPGASRHNSARDEVRHKIVRIDTCLRTVSDERELLGLPAGRVLIDPSLLITGMWGTGKTHLLCDITRQRESENQPTLLVLAKSFQGDRDLLPGISSTVVPGASPEALFDRLQKLGEASGERVIVIVDGVNEGRRAEWKRAIAALLALARTRNHIGIIVSCRTPFERASIAAADLDDFQKVEHRGFEDQEFDAHAAFFEYYKLPLPEVPLLDSEFSRPLTLKLICQSLQNLTGKKIREGFSGIASGQKGMTYVLESFVNRVGETIEKEFALPAKACWWVLKGGTRIADPRAAGFAPNMAATMREYVRPGAARSIIAAHFPTLSAKRRRELLDALRTNGLIDEDVIWHRSKGEVKPRTVYRLPYQRFSDHLVARHLLDKYLTATSERSVQRSFMRGSPLARVFRQGRYRHGYAREGWAQALITEFPERVRKVVPRTRRELYFFLPPAAKRLGAYYLPFVEGLFWRDPSAFTKGTGRLVNALLNAVQSSEYRLLDALVAVATKPKHPYSAVRLYKFLAGMKMPERDLWWSEYLRKGYSSPTIRRLMAWAGRLERAEMAEESARELVVLFSLALTTVVRQERDLATRALVVIGERHPRVLFEHTVESLAFGDPYVPERMLAASFGVTMSLVDDPAAADFRQHLAWFAGRLYRSMFTPRAPYRTNHVLRRDYALGVINIARRGRMVPLPRAADRHLAPPFAQLPSPFPDISAVTDEVHETGSFAIHMDFGNYTIGGLIPGRGNYQSDHPEYKCVLAQIEWRIHDLGLRRKEFELIDNDIGRSSYSRGRDGRQTDRYGKKYAWIAYFEMYGVRENRRLLPEWREKERTPDCDVDPSFPKEPPRWTPTLPDVFKGTFVSPADWLANGPTPAFEFLRVETINDIAGPWILLDGHVQQNDADRRLQIWTFLRGLFVRRADVRRLRDLYLKIEYPGNNAIPHSGEDSYVYAGEIGRSAFYAHQLLRRDGTYRRQTDSAFEEYKWIPDPTGADKTDTAQPAITENDDRTFLLRYGFSRGRSQRIPGVRVELPLRSFGWESYHSALNQFRGFDVPAPALIEKLELHTQNRGVDFFDRSGRQATLYREEGSLSGPQRISLFYLREDLLRAYLRRTRQTLAWLNWGERNTRHEGFERESDPEVIKLIQEHKHIHRTFVTFDGLTKE